MRQLIPTFLLIAFPAVLFAVEMEIRVRPDKVIASLGSRPEPLGIDELVGASLIASGISGDLQKRYTGELNVVLASLKKAIVNPGGVDEVSRMAEATLVWMHEELLSRYIESQTRIDVLLDTGRFNCVSSAVLFILLCRSLGIQAGGVLTVDHAFVRILDSGSWVDVETTTKYGFNPGENKKGEASFAGLTGFRYVSPRNYRDRQDIGEKEMISLIYQNRISDLQRKNRWVETVGLARDRYELSRNERTWNDYISSLGNYGAYMGREGRELEALKVFYTLSGEIDVAGNLGETVVALFSNGITRLIRRSAFNEARSIINEIAITALVPEEHILRQEQQIGLMELQESVRAKGFEASVNDINRALSEKVIDQSRWEELILYRYSREARKRFQDSRWLEGYYFLSAAPASVRAIGEYAELEENYRKNSVVHFHNRFVREFRGRNYQLASEILDEAQKIFPDEVVLKEDRQKLLSQS